MYELDDELLEKYSAQYSRSKLQSEAEIQYGTAGFRRKATDLPHIVFRMGLLASVRSQYCNGAIGLMITASHNPVEDNGIKLIDPHGEMLEMAWERYATQLANCDDAALNTVLRNLIAEVGSLQSSGRHAAASKADGTRVNFSETKPVILLGRDTRPSCIELCEAAIAGATCFKAYTIDFGVVTTPILHYLVRCTNDKQHNATAHSDNAGADAQQQPDSIEALRYELAYGEPNVTGYYEKLSRSFIKLLRLFGVSRNPRPTLTVDCANGVGFEHLRALSAHIPAELLQVSFVNVGDGQLNVRCGADFVKLERRFPLNAEPSGAASEGGPGRFVSLDGDADRIVYFYASPASGACCLLDGDKIALLITRFVARLLRDAQSQAQLALGAPSASDGKPLGVRIGVVQTAYANGSSTSAITSVGCGVETSCVPTGVKFLHAKAIEYDVGVFFEANGHGTALFSDRLKRQLQDSLRHSYSVEVDRLLTTINLVNETVGDALSDLLVIEAILAIEAIGVADWDALYADLPSRQLKVVVPDRSKVRTTYDERRVVEPQALQDAVDSIIESARQGTLCDAAPDQCVRSFVRPSGTEDVVRVYAEATLQSTADLLAQRVGDAVRSILN